MLSSCLASALDQWSANGGYIGGKIAQGAGKVSWKYIPDFPDKCIYENFVLENASILKELLNERLIWKLEESLFGLVNSVHSK
jgi:hypothetical protein